MTAAVALLFIFQYILPSEFIFLVVQYDTNVSMHLNFKLTLLDISHTRYDSWVQPSFHHILQVSSY